MSVCRFYEVFLMSMILSFDFSLFKNFLPLVLESLLPGRVPVCIFPRLVRNLEFKHLRYLNHTIYICKYIPYMNLPIYTIEQNCSFQYELFKGSRSLIFDITMIITQAHDLIVSLQTSSFSHDYKSL